MAKPKNGTEEETSALDDNALIANVLGLLLCRGQNNTESVKILSRVGFNNRRIAGMLNTTPDTVRVTLYDANNSKKKVKATRG